MNKQQRNILAGVLAATTVDILLLAAVRPSAGLVAACVGMAAVGAVLAAWALRLLRDGADDGLDDLREAVERCAADEEDALPPDLTGRGGAVGALAQAVQRLAEREDDRLEQACRSAAQEAEERARRSMAEEICASALPQVLPDIPSRAHFEVSGLIEQGMGRDCRFYDYFFIDPGLLCIVLGQTPGGGVAEALFMVIAQTTIRSRLRQGRSLEETMADVNTQLYDLGSQFSLNALVATLSTADGRFTYVNAGQQQPLFMRNEDRYEWLEAPVYAPLGMNENVSYRSQELRFKQGDRIFLNTAGLTDLPDRTGEAYGGQRLRADPNTSRSKNLDSGELLRFVADHALAHCSSGRDNGGFALLTLLFCKGDKELAHCDVPARPEYAGEVTAFLKKQFEDNGIDKRHYAREAVVVDEVFALCCRRAEPDSHVMVECGVAPDAQMVNIRVTAVLDGVDPMESADAEPAGNAVSFIRDNADYITFKPGKERDTITIVCFLS